MVVQNRIYVGVLNGTQLLYINNTNIYNTLNMEIYRIVEQKLEYFNYSDKTSKIYIYYIEKFISSVKKNPALLTSNDFETYLLNYKYTSISQQNQIINAIKFLYKKVLKHELLTYDTLKREYVIKKFVKRSKIKHILEQNHHSYETPSGVSKQLGK